MIATMLATIVIAMLAMLPGLLLLRGAAPKPGQWAAAATVSLVAMMVGTALLGELAHELVGIGLPAATIVPVSLAASTAYWRATRDATDTRIGFEWPSLCLATAFVGYGIFCEAISVREDSSGALLIHSWYNADWFKHLGHVAALADYGVPARDVFNEAGPLYYYWLSYVLPGAGAALGGDNWAALDAANIVTTTLFCLTFYGTVRLSGAGPRTTLLATLLCLFVCAPTGFAYALLTQAGGVEGILYGAGAPNDPALAGLARYVPQHTMALTTLLAWIVLNRPDAPAPKSLRAMALAALASVMTLSTLVGAMALAVYGLVALWNKRAKAVPEVAAMAVLSVLLVLALGVIQVSHPNSAIESPLLNNAPDPRPWFTRLGQSVVLVIGGGGFPFLLGLILLRAWRTQGEPDRYAFRIAVVFYAVAILAAIAVELLLTRRLGIEIRNRAVNLPAVSVAIVGAWALAWAWAKNRSARLAAIGITAFLVLIALPAIYVQTVWHAQLGDRFTTRVPRDDRQVLAWLHSHSPRRAVVWQYPEPPALANPSGDDAWAVIFGGRTVTGSLRATDYAPAAPRIEAARRYFAGEEVAVPHEADWIYLSRALHPETYDALLARLGGDADWAKRECRQDACLFERRAAAT